MTSTKKESLPTKTQTDDVKLPDPVALSQALMKVYEKSAPLFQESLQHLNEELAEKNYDPFNLRDAYISFWEKVMEDPDKFIQLQSDFWNDYLHLWQQSYLRLMGEEAEDVIEPEQGDRRFRSEEWSKNAIFDFIKQSYLLTSQYMNDAAQSARGLDEEKQKKLTFATKLFADALSPTNFFATNPDVLKETIRSGGENLVKGLENLVEDLKRGHGELKISTTQYDAFELGRNIAVTPGKVVYQNDLIQLIQYEPQTKKAFKRPLLVVPPWINKYYILDLRAENSFMRWLVEQGHTVFMISWVNPDKKLAQKSFEDYLNEGLLASLDEIKNITGENDANVIGYCLGGTLLSVGLSYLKSKKLDKRVASATFLTTLIDFEDSGDLKLFMDDEQLRMMEKDMSEKGFFEAKQLQQTFKLLRANDMIWSFVVNNYMMGKEPFPFDLLYWNDDSTNLPAAMHSYYLRNMYRQNLLTVPGGITMNDTPIDVTKIKTPAYFLSTKEDHIAPWQATFAGAALLSGEVTFTLAASGHIAGVVNPPAKNKYCYWESKTRQDDPDVWLKGAKQHDGSWWPHWQKWMKPYLGEKIEARKIKKALEDAPGSYVKSINP